MDKINKFLLAQDKFVPELHLRQQGIAYIACQSFTKNRKNTKI